MVGEWLPHTASFLMLETALPVLAASWLAARLWSKRSMAVKLVGLRSGAAFMAIKALVLAGLPTTSTLTLREATALRALPWAVKMAPLMASNSARSMPGPRGREPTNKA